MARTLSDYFNAIKLSVEAIEDERHDMRFSEVRSRLVSICCRGIDIEKNKWTPWNIPAIQSELESKSADFVNLIGYTDTPEKLWKLDSDELIQLASVYLCAQQKLYQGEYKFLGKVATPSKDLDKLSGLIAILTESINYWQNALIQERVASEPEIVLLDAGIAQINNERLEEEADEGGVSDVDSDDGVPVIHPEEPPVTSTHQTLIFLLIQFRSNNSSHHARRVSCLLVILSCERLTTDERLQHIDQQIKLFKPQFSRNLGSKIKHIIYWFFWAESNFQSENWGCSHRSDDLLESLNKLKEDISNHPPSMT